MYILRNKLTDSLCFRTIKRYYSVPQTTRQVFYFYFLRQVTFIINSGSLQDLRYNDIWCNLLHIVTHSLCEHERLRT